MSSFQQILPSVFTINVMSHLLSVPSNSMWVGKLGSMYGELTSISSMGTGSDQESNL